MFSPPALSLMRSFISRDGYELLSPFFSKVD